VGDDDEVAREPPDKQRPSLPSSVPRSRRTRKRHLDELGHLRRVLAEELGPRLQFGQRLGAADTTTPVARRLGVLVRVVGLDGRDELGELGLVLGADVAKGEDRRGLAADNGTEAGLALDDDVGDAHLLAEGREEDDELDRVNVVGNDDEVGLLGLDERHDVVEARLDEVGLLGLVEVLLAGSEVSRLGLEARLLLLLGLALVLVGEAEQLRGSVLVEDVRELGDRGGRLEALVKDDLLALEADVLRPLDEAGQVGRGANRLANAERLGARLEERVGRLLRRLGSAGSLGNLASRGLLHREGRRGGSKEGGAGH